MVDLGFGVVALATGDCEGAESLFLGLASAGEEERSEYLYVILTGLGTILPDFSDASPPALLVLDFLLEAFSSACSRGRFLLVGLIWRRI